MKISKLVPAALIAAICSVGSGNAAPGQAKSSKASMPHIAAATILKQDTCKLWTGHVVWTRDYIVAAVGDQPDAQAAANRLMKNQEDIGNAIATFYGASAGQQLTTRLKQHISIAVDLIKAAKAGGKAAQQQADGSDRCMRRV